MGNVSPWISFGKASLVTSACLGSTIKCILSLYSIKVCETSVWFWYPDRSTPCNLVHFNSVLSERKKFQSDLSILIDLESRSRVNTVSCNGFHSNLAWRTVWKNFLVPDTNRTLCLFPLLQKVEGTLQQRQSMVHIYFCLYFTWIFLGCALKFLRGNR